MQGSGSGSSLRLLCLRLGTYDQGISIDSSYHHSVAKINKAYRTRTLGLLGHVMV